jgi:hypothetical protein
MLKAVQGLSIGASKMNSVTTLCAPWAILDGVPRVGYDVHLCPFPGSLYACLQYLGDPRDYDYLMGVTGAAFRRLWNRDDGGNVDLSYLGDEPFGRVFEALGYAWSAIPAEKGAMIEAILESIARRRPAISFGIIGPPEAGIVAGYDECGQVLYGYSYFQEGRNGYYQKRDWFETMDKSAGRGLIVIGDRSPSLPSDRETLIASLEWAIELARTAQRPMLPNHAAGLAAYDAWADGLGVDADYPAEAPQVLQTRAMVHCDQCAMLYERHQAAHYLRKMARVAPEAAKALQAAAALYDRAADQESALWHWSNWMAPEALTEIADADHRRTFAQAIRAARAAEAQAVALLEQALSALQR